MRPTNDDKAASSGSMEHLTSWAWGVAATTALDLNAAVANAAEGLSDALHDIVDDGETLFNALVANTFETDDTASAATPANTLPHPFTPSSLPLEALPPRAAPRNPNAPRVDEPPCGGHPRACALASGGFATRTDSTESFVMVHVEEAARPVAC